MATEPMVKVYAPVTIPQITRYDEGEEKHYARNPYDGSMMVPERELEDFIVMGLTREPPSEQP